MSSTPTVPTIGINLLWLVPGTVGGSEESTVRSLLAVARALGTAVRLKAYVRPELVNEHPELADAGIEQVVVPTMLDSKAMRVLAENTWLSAVSRNDDLVHYAGGAVTVTGRRPAISTIHDLQPLDHPERFSALKVRWLNWLLPLTVRKSIRIVVPSAFTAERCMTLLGAAPEQLAVLAHGYEAGPYADLPTELEGRRFVLLPGIANRHKGHLRAVELHRQLAEEFPDLMLVFTGTPGPMSAEVRSRSIDAGTADRVIELGRVDADVLARLYREAALLYFPSSYEGFGYPLLEAMAHGCPVVAARATASAEVVGDAGLLFSLADETADVDAARSVLVDDELRASLVAAGHRRAEEFSYEANGVGLAAVYCDALGISGVL